MAVVVTAVLIHASGIHLPQGRRNWERTIERAVVFREGRPAEALSSWERAELERLHPDGSAQLWGTHGYYSAQAARLAEGDVVIFTGKGRVLAIGRIGLLTDNPALADALWPRHPRHGSYRHVYSLAPLDFVDISYPEFRVRGGFGAADDFRGLRVLVDARAEEVLAAFGDEIPPPTGAPALSSAEQDLQDVREYEAADEDVARDLSWVRELEIEIEVRSAGDSHVRARASSVMHRGENLLVHDYVQSLGDGARWCRFVTPVGVTDLDVWRDGRHELIEAKSSVSRHHVRQALAQLLDYAPALSDDPPDVLTALFPQRPDESAVAYLNRYGIDCVYRDEAGAYRRQPASFEAAAALRSTGTSANER